MTPLQHQLGIVTPNGLFFERHHNGVARDRPRPAPARRSTAWCERPLGFHDDRPDAIPVGVALPLHGMLGQQPDRLAEGGIRRPSSRRTACWPARSGPASRSRLLLDEAGVKPEGKWVMFEGADGCGHARSIPIEEDARRCAAGLRHERREAARRERLSDARCSSPAGKATSASSGCAASRSCDQPWHLRSETARYTDPMPDGKWRQFSYGDGGQVGHHAARRAA